MGKSPAPPLIASSDDVLAAVHDFVDDSIGDSSFLVIGESLGGYLGRALVRDGADQVLGLALICPIGAAVRRENRTVPVMPVLRPDPGLIASLDERSAAEFAAMAVVQTPETARRFRDEILAGLDLADGTAIARIELRWTLSSEPETRDPFVRPTLILTGRRDKSVGYADQFALLPHYPRATFAVLDVAGHNLRSSSHDCSTP